MSDIADRLHAVRQRICDAAVKAGRSPDNVRLLAVSKTFDATAVRDAFDAGQRDFGENYVQEAIGKITALADIRTALIWHFIGPLQSNKTRSIAERFDWVHSVDRLKIAERLSEQRPAHCAPLQVCLQINVSGEDTKSGVPAQAALELARQIAVLPRLQLRGLMTIPAPTDTNDTEQGRRAPFRALSELWQQMRTDGLQLDTLSMGMSADLEPAIAEGATIVRVGTAIFGVRSRAQIT